MSNDVDDLAKRTAALEQRTTATEFSKADKKEIDDIKKDLSPLQQRTSAIEFSKTDKKDFDELKTRPDRLESKFSIAVGVAIALGVSGAAIGGLMANAYNRINKIKDDTSKLDSTVSGLNPKVDALNGKVDTLNNTVDTLEAKVIRDVTEVGKAKVLEIYNAANQAIARLTIVQHQFCIGESAQRCAPLPQHDCGSNPDAIASALCAGLQHNPPTQYSSVPGGHCGYGSFEVTCFGVKS
jgi:predicted nuclease with TOPRIM domain